MNISTTDNGEIKRARRKIPKAVPFILMNILLERYSTTGTTAILLLYLHKKLGFDQSTSTALFHTNELLAYFFTIFGAIIADSFWGLFKTLVIMSFIFTSGSALVSISSIEPLHLPATILTLVGLLIAVVGSGSIRANLTSFGGNQYKIPDDAESLKLYFSIQIVFLKIGSLLGRLINPILKEDIECFDMDNCYPLAFATPTLTMIIALIILLSGKRFYVQKPLTGNVFLKVCGCIYCGLKELLWKNNQLERKNHWLDYANTKYDEQLIKDTKQVLRILVIFTPIPIYWAVYMQQSSRWIFQATRTNGDIGFYIIKPDQMIALNPLFAILFMPVCNYIFFPCLAKFNLDSLLHRIAIGFVLCCAAFGIAIFTELKIESDLISILWLFPQFAVLALSENFAFTSMLNFAFTEGPSSMKSVMTSCVFVTISFGNLIITFISGTKLFSSQVYEFLFFIGVLFIALVIFLILASRFKKYSDETENK